MTGTPSSQRSSTSTTLYVDGIWERDTAELVLAAGPRGVEKVRVPHLSYESVVSDVLACAGLDPGYLREASDSGMTGCAGRHVASYTKGPGTSTDLQFVLLRPLEGHFTDHLGSPVASGDPDVLSAGGGRYVTTGGRLGRLTGSRRRSTTLVTLRSPAT